MVVADHAGSGKTLAYMGPLVQLLREEETHAQSSLTRPRRPRIIVVAPTEGERENPLSDLGYWPCWCRSLGVLCSALAQHEALIHVGDAASCIWESSGRTLNN